MLSHLTAAERRAVDLIGEYGEAKRSRHTRTWRVGADERNQPLHLISDRVIDSLWRAGILRRESQWRYGVRVVMARTSSHPGDGIATPPQLQTTGDAPSSATTVAMAEQAGQK